MGRTQKQDGERGIDQEDIFDRVILFLATITRRLFRQGLGGGRSAARSRHGQKGGGRCGGWDRGNRGRVLLQRVDDSGHVSLRDTKPLGQGRQGAGGGIAEGAQRRQQRRQEDMNLLIRFALDHPE